MFSSINMSRDISVFYLDYLGLEILSKSNSSGWADAGCISCQQLRWLDKQKPAIFLHLFFKIK